MKNLLIKILFALAITFTPLCLHSIPSQSQRSIDAVQSCAPQYQNALAKIHQVPEARQLIAKIQSNGPISIKVNNSVTKDFAAFWEGFTRTILITPSQQNSEGSLIASMIFEMHNALSDAYLEGLIQDISNGKLSKDAYVEKVEKMEYENAKGAIAILQSGVKRGIFPKDARLELLSNFEDHYMTQQVYGHSIWIAEQFDNFCPGPRQSYKGTVPNLNQLTQQDKRDILYFIALKNDINSEVPEVAQRARQMLKTEQNSLQNNFARDQRQHKKQQLFNFVFQGA